jgi:hypothetical protein
MTVVPPQTITIIFYRSHSKCIQCITFLKYRGFLPFSPFSPFSPLEMWHELSCHNFETTQNYYQWGNFENTFNDFLCLHDYTKQGCYITHIWEYIIPYFTLRTQQSPLFSCFWDLKQLKLVYHSLSLGSHITFYSF